MSEKFPQMIGVWMSKGTIYLLLMMWPNEERLKGRGK